MTWFIAHFDTTLVYDLQSIVTTWMLLLGSGFQRRTLPFLSGFPKYPLPQLPTSHKNSSKRLNCNRSSTSTESQNYVTTDGRSASQSWCQAAILGRETDSWCYQIVAGADVGLPFWREDGSVAYKHCCPSPAQSWGFDSRGGLVTIFYCLKTKNFPNS
jgi:hypothetical protein